MKNSLETSDCKDVGGGSGVGFRPATAERKAKVYIWTLHTCRKGTEKETFCRFYNRSQSVHSTMMKNICREWVEQGKGKTIVLRAFGIMSCCAPRSIFSYRQPTSLPLAPNGGAKKKLPRLKKLLSPRWMMSKWFHKYANIYHSHFTSGRPVGGGKKKRRTRAPAPTLGKDKK